jgi:C-terminal novel E3 ligase, LRR-interacting
MHAIASDAALRTQVFTLAEDALGTCGDNLDEGFSNIRLAVDNHRMARAVERGEVNAEQLNHWAGSLFRLSLLETAVQRFIHTELQRPDLTQRQRDALTDEPLETKAHAKVELRESLGLPSSTASAMRYSISSVLGDSELLMLEQQVKAESVDGGKRDNFLLGHPTWRAGMKALHAQKFKDFQLERDADPFHNFDVPEDLEGQANYAAEAARINAEWDQKENALLLRLAREGGEASGS